MVVFRIPWSDSRGTVSTSLAKGRARRADPRAALVAMVEWVEDFLIHSAAEPGSLCVVL